MEPGLRFHPGDGRGLRCPGSRASGRGQVTRGGLARRDQVGRRQEQVGERHDQQDREDHGDGQHESGYSRAAPTRHRHPRHGKPRQGQRGQADPGEPRHATATARAELVRRKVRRPAVRAVDQRTGRCHGLLPVERQSAALAPDVDRQIRIAACRATDPGTLKPSYHVS